MAFMNNATEAEMNAERTPGPWIVMGRANGYIRRMDAPHGELAVARVMTGRSKEEFACNAAFIVLACNAHDELVAALERTAHALELAYSKKPLRDMAETLAEANAILAKVKGQS